MVFAWRVDLFALPIVFMLTEAHQVELLKFAEVLADAARPGILKAHAQVDTSIEIKRYDEASLKKAASVVDAFAKMESLDAHGKSLKARLG
ncbi:hypothetical protein EBZ97_04770 [bacterium]|nr:hypothetical protein [bacterium]